MKEQREKKAEETIFVQIASYRDPQLLPTLKDMIDKADYPENLRIGIAWQHHKDDAWDNLDKYKNDKRFRILDIEANDSKGVCWARNLVQQVYLNEKYTLQLDSHHRFVSGWDTLLIDMLKDLQIAGSPKPLITGYIPSFNPEKDPEERVQEPWKMNFDRFIPEGAIFFLHHLTNGTIKQNHYQLDFIVLILLLVLEISLKKSCTILNIIFMEKKSMSQSEHILMDMICIILIR